LLATGNDRSQRRPSTSSAHSTRVSGCIRQPGAGRALRRFRPTRFSLRGGIGTGRDVLVEKALSLDPEMETRCCSVRICRLHDEPCAAEPTIAAGSNWPPAAGVRGLAGVCTKRRRAATRRRRCSTGRLDPLEPARRDQIGVSLHERGDIQAQTHYSSAY
jgi:hypothetical protein